MWNCPWKSSDHADHRSMSSRQLGQQQQMPDDHTSWDCVEAPWGNDAWQNENVVDWPRQVVHQWNSAFIAASISSAVMRVKRTTTSELCYSKTVSNFSRTHFYPCDAMLAQVIAIATCLSVCLSRAGIVSKRRKLAAWFLHHLVAPRLVFWRQILSPNSKGSPHPNAGLKEG